MEKLQPHLVPKYAKSKIAPRGMIPHRKPSLPSTCSIIAILHGQGNWIDARDVTDSTDYSALIEESERPGCPFVIDSLYSVNNLFLDLCVGEDMRHETAIVPI